MCGIPGIGFARKAPCTRVLYQVRYRTAQTRCVLHCRRMSVCTWYHACRGFSVVFEHGMYILSLQDVPARVLCVYVVTLCFAGGATPKLSVRVLHGSTHVVFMAGQVERVSEDNPESPLVPFGTATQSSTAGRRLVSSLWRYSCKSDPANRRHRAYRLRPVVERNAEVNGQWPS